MKSSVEAVANPAKVTATPFRQSWRPRVVCVVDRSNPEFGASRILARIKENERGGGTSSYVFVDAVSGCAYVMTEDQQFLRDVLARLHRSPWFARLVGHYCTVRPADPKIPVLRVTQELLVGDLLEHFG